VGFSTTFRRRCKKKDCVAQKILKEMMSVEPRVSPATVNPRFSAGACGQTLSRILWITCRHSLCKSTFVRARKKSSLMAVIVLSVSKCALVTQDAASA
jgi:hypothetical protein